MFRQIDLSRQIKGETNAGNQVLPFALMLHIPNTSYSFKRFAALLPTTYRGTLLLPNTVRAKLNFILPQASALVGMYLGLSTHEFQSLVREREVRIVENTTAAAF